MSGRARSSGANRTGVFTGVWTAGETLGLALGTGLYALVLATGGYGASRAGAVTQPPSAVTAALVGFTAVPAVLVALSLVPLLLHRPASEGVRPGRST